jgi:hypothetical protein
VRCTSSHFLKVLSENFEHLTIDFAGAGTEKKEEAVKEVGVPENRNKVGVDLVLLGEDFALEDLRRPRVVHFHEAEPLLHLAATYTHNERWHFRTRHGITC